MSSPIVYLAGPINDATVEQAADWRESWADRLNTLGYSYIDPFESKEVLRLHQHTGRNLDNIAIERGLITAEEIIQHSLAMTEASDIIVLNFLDLRKNNIHTVGTPAELIFATMYQTVQNKPAKYTIVLANDTYSSFFTLANIILDSEEALFEHLTSLKTLDLGTYGDNSHKV
jgi:hypothetical protein